MLTFVKNPNKPSTYECRFAGHFIMIRKFRGAWEWLIEDERGNLVDWGGRWACRMDCASELKEKIESLLPVEIAA